MCVYIYIYVFFFLTVTQVAGDLKYLLLIALNCFKFDNYFRISY